MTDQLLQYVIIIFMLFLCVLCLFAVLVIARDVVLETVSRRKSKDEKDEATKPAEAAAPVVIVKEVAAPAPVVEEIKEPEPVEEPEIEPEQEIEPEAETEEEDENAVKFSTTHKLTMEEKYATLSSEYKSYFDSIVKHALSKEGVKENKNTGYYDYKIGSARLVRVAIKRNEIVCEFIFIDQDFKNYAENGNVKMKPSATKIRITEASAVGVAKDGIDLVCQQIAEEKERKKALAREKRNERRREQRQKEKEENTEAETAKEEAVV